jgi:hypothetical protein
MPPAVAGKETSVKDVRHFASASVATIAALFLASQTVAVSRAQAPDKPAADKPAAEKTATDRTPLGGLWTLNKDLSDQPPGGDSSSQGDTDRRSTDPGSGGGRRRGGGMGRGGYGGGMGRGGYGGGSSPAGNPEDIARMRDAIKDIMSPPAHLTIVQTDSMVILTGPDGRTTRLSFDGKKVKDESTKIERKTKWDGGKLVSEISGAGPGKMTQTLAIDPEHHQLRISVVTEGGRGQPKNTSSVYDADAK